MRPDASSIENLLSAGADRDFFFSRKRKLFVANASASSSSRAHTRERERNSFSKTSFDYSELCCARREDALTQERVISSEREM